MRLRRDSVLSLLTVLTLPFSLRADQTFVYAVEVNATVQTAPARIHLQWTPDPYGATRHTIFRKRKSATSWGTGTVLPGAATTYTDQNVTPGAAYEYQIVRYRPDRTAYGYIYAGVNAPLKENRGKLLLLVDNRFAAELSTELSRLKADLVGDGWQVIRRNVSSTHTPQRIKNLVVSVYRSDPARVKALFLFGHVPIFRSGSIDYDGKGPRLMPADAFYADVDGDWSGNPSFLPSDVELMVGRVDFFNMPGEAAPVPWPGELELLRNYLNKNHEFRHNIISVPRRALVANRVGDEGGLASAASGYRNFAPLVGLGNIVEANVEDNAPPDERWISIVSRESFLWSYGSGGGSYRSISQLGTRGIYNDVLSTDVIAHDARAVFSMLYGSALGEWDTRDNIMRAMLATPSVGLTVCLGGKPHWFFHHMGLGEPVGHSARLTMNNRRLYKNEKNAFARGVHISLLGDPTLRLDPVSPPSDLTAVRTGSRVDLSWSPSADTVRGYHVYRANRPSGPFLRLTNRPTRLNTFSDFRSAQAATYMIRAIKLQVNPSGSYYNPSQGVFAFVGPR